MLTKNRRLKRRWIGDDRYVLCLDEPETVNDLFYGMPKHQSCAPRTAPEQTLLFNCCLSSRLWKASRLKGGAVGGRELATIDTAWWFIRPERNNKIFEN